MEIGNMVQAVNVTPEVAVNSYASPVAATSFQDILRAAAEAAKQAPKLGEVMSDTSSEEDINQNTSIQEIMLAMMQSPLAADIPVLEGNVPDGADELLMITDISKRQTIDSLNKLAEQIVIKDSTSTSVVIPELEMPQAVIPEGMQTSPLAETMPMNEAVIGSDALMQTNPNGAIPIPQELLTGTQTEQNAQTKPSAEQVQIPTVDVQTKPLAEEQVQIPTVNAQSEPLAEQQVQIPTVNAQTKPLAEQVQIPTVNAQNEPLAEQVQIPTVNVQNAQTKPLAEQVQIPTANVQNAQTKPLAEQVQISTANVQNEQTKPLAEQVKIPTVNVQNAQTKPLAEQAKIPTMNVQTAEKLVEQIEIPAAQTQVTEKTLAAEIEQAISSLSKDNPHVTHKLAEHVSVSKHAAEDSVKLQGENVDETLTAKVGEAETKVFKNNTQQNSDLGQGSSAEKQSANQESTKETDSHNAISSVIERSTSAPTQTVDVQVTDAKTNLEATTVRHIVDQVKFNLSSDRSEFVMQLVPENLGKIAVKMVSQNGMLTVEIMAENPKTQSLLAGNAADIKELLMSSQSLNAQVVTPQQSQQLDYTKQESQQQQQGGQQEKQQKPEDPILDFTSLLQELQLETRISRTY